MRVILYQRAPAKACHLVGVLRTGGPIPNRTDEVTGQGLTYLATDTKVGRIHVNFPSVLIGVPTTDTVRFSNRLP